MGAPSIEIPLANGGVVLVSSEDAEFVGNRNWFRGKGGYAVANHSVSGKRRQVYMHRLLLGATRGQVVDHIDGDRLNNTRGNIRVTDKRGNSLNRGAPANSRTGFKGIRIHPMLDGCFIAEIRGTFDSIESAARAYDACVPHMHGEFGRLHNMEDE